MSTLEFNFTDEEFIKIVNQICTKESYLGREFVPFTSIEEVIDINVLDSLGMIIFFVWLADLFEISDTEIAKFAEAGSFTIAQLKAFVLANHTKTYTYAEAQELYKKCF